MPPGGGGGGGVCDGGLVGRFLGTSPLFFNVRDSHGGGWIECLGEEDKEFILSLGERVLGEVEVASVEVVVVVMAHRL